jgi:hypothetical protein
MSERRESPLCTHSDQRWYANQMAWRHNFEYYLNVKNCVENERPTYYYEDI